jgi:hypothetical protein
MRRLVIPRSIYKDAEAGKVTAGLGSISPLTRALRDVAGYKAEYQQQVVDEAQLKADNAVASDAGRPRISLDAQMGTPRTGQWLRKKVLALLPHAKIKTVLQSDGTDNYNLYLDSRDEAGNAIEIFVGGWPAAKLMPEFSKMNWKLQNRVNKDTGERYVETVIDPIDPEIRGWRTIAVRLVRNGAITRAAYDKSFGVPSHDSERHAVMIGDREG